jgi:META domain
MTRLAILFVTFTVLAAACGTDSDAGPGTDPGGGGTRPSVAGGWILGTLVVDGADVALPDGDIDMMIASGEISGTLGCNSFAGSIDAADDGSVTIGALAQTEMACLEDGRMEFEAAYGQALSSVRAWAVDPAGLTLSSDTIEIRYRSAPPALNLPLVGTVWNFDTIYEGAGVDRAATSRSDMVGVTLVIEGSEATLAGPACTGTVISVEYDGGSEGEFRTGAGGDLTTNAECAIVGAALGGLVDATGFMIDENRLTFIGGPGETVGFLAEPA